MVRPFPTLTTLHHTITLIFASLAIFSVLSILTLLCASHNKIKQFKLLKSNPFKKPSICRDKRLFSDFTGNVGASGKALLKMVSWQRVNNNDEEEEEEVVEKFDEDEDVVWRKTIMMGEKCRPFDFSGKIEYDCEGNPLPSDDDKRVGKIKGDQNDT